MIKKLFALLLCLGLVLSLGVSASAGAEGYIIDGQKLLWDEESLELLAQEIFDKYGLAVAYVSAGSDEGLSGAEYAQRLYARYIDAPDGILLLDCRDYSTYYMHYSGKALDIFVQGDGNTMMSAYDGSATYDEAVRAYLEAADAVLSQRLGTSRSLVLLDDLSQDSPAPAPTAEPESELPLLSLDGSSQTTAAQTAQPVQPVQTVQPTVPAIPAQRQLPLVVDTAGVLDPSLVASLNDRAEALGAKYGADVALVYVNSTGGKSIQAFADDFYDYNGYGYGESDSGIMLCIAVQDRKFAISSYGPAAYTFSDYGQAYLDEAYLPYLRNSDWSSAAGAYYGACEKLLEYERVNGKPYDVDSSEPESLLGGQILLSLLSGFVLAFIPIGSMKRKMLNVRKKNDAAGYVQSGSFRLGRSNDRYITSQITRVPKPKQNNDMRGGGPSGGGTSFHMSSSGRPHGGHSGSF